MKKIYTLALSMISALIFSSCVDLNLNPLSEGSSENWYSSAAEIEMSLNDFYRTDFFILDGVLWADDVVRRSDTQFTFNGTMTAENGTVASHWQNYYKGIARGLRILKNLEEKGSELGIPEATINQYKGEALLYIGYAYGMLAFRWGDVILDKTGMTLEEAYSASRSPKSEVVAFALECLDKAAQLLPTECGGVQRFTKGAAYAFKARIAIYNGDYANAATAAKACMDLGVYSLHENYQDLFTATTSPEWIFVFKGDYALKKYYWIAGDTRNYMPRLAPGGWAANNPSHELVCAYTCTDGLPIDESPLYNPKAIFDHRDPRMAMTIAPFAQPASECVVNGTYDPADYELFGYEHSPSPLKNVVVKISDGSYANNVDSKACALHAAYNGFVLKKYADPETWTAANNYVGVNAYPFLRYGDVLLMYAEAMNEQGKCDQAVLDATINKLRERAYRGTGIEYPKVTVGSQSELRTIIRTERFVELAAEGHRYEDLIRWKIAEVVFNRPVYYLERVWSGTSNWINGDSITPLDPAAISDTYVKLCKNWEEGNYPIGGVPEIDENGIADVRYMEAAGYVVKATERQFNPARDYLWPIPAADRLINENLTQNPGY